MWRRKKWVIVAVLTAVVLAGSIGGAVFATDGDADSQPGTQHQALLNRVCEIYEANMGVAIDPGALADAFAQAHDEIRTEAMQNRLQSLVEKGDITQEQADQYLEWQQARPDVPFGPGARFGLGFRGHGGPRGFGGPCLPWNSQ